MKGRKKFWWKTIQLFSNSWINFTNKHAYYPMIMRHTNSSKLWKQSHANAFLRHEGLPHKNVWGRPFAIVVFHRLLWFQSTALKWGVRRHVLELDKLHFYGNLREWILDALHELLDLCFLLLAGMCKGWVIHLPKPCSTVHSKTLLTLSEQVCNKRLMT